VTEQLTSAATSRLELRISRLFALTLFVASIETIANAWQQYSILTPVGIAVASLVALTVLLVQVSAWQRTVKRFWVGVFAALSFLSMLLWPWSISNPAELASDFQPWVWWLIGMGVVAMGVVAKPLFAVLYLIATSLTWLWLDTSSYAGSSEFFASLQDASYIFLFGGSILGLFMVVRAAVLDVDIANTAAIKSAVEQARVDAE
jgi:hypothetical protein